MPVEDMILPSRSRRAIAEEVGAYRWSSCGGSEISALEKQPHRMSSRSCIVDGLESEPYVRSVLSLEQRYPLDL